MKKKSATHAVDKAKNKQLTIIIAVILVVIIIASCGIFSAFYYRDYSVNPSLPDDVMAKNVILLIGDGMGENHIDVASLKKELAMTKAPVSGTMATRSFSLSPTSSSASATAMATGKKVFNKNVGYLMGDNLTSIGQLASESGKKVGYVTNGTAYNETIASFTANAKNCSDYTDIALQQVQNSHIDYLVGTGASYYNDYASKINTEDRTYINSYEDLATCNADKQFAILADDEINPTSNCSLATLTQDALDKLDNNNDEGFLLVVENDAIGKKAEAKDMDGMIAEITAFDSAVETAMIYASMHKEDTLVIVVGDQETAKINLPKDNDPTAVTNDCFKSTSNSYNNVRYYAIGVGADAIPAHIDNSDIFNIIYDVMNL